MEVTQALRDLLSIVLASILLALLGYAWLVLSAETLGLAWRGVWRWLMNEPWRRLAQWCVPRHAPMGWIPYGHPMSDVAYCRMALANELRRSMERLVFAMGTPSSFAGKAGLVFQGIDNLLGVNYKEANNDPD